MFSTCTESASVEGENLVRLYAELGRLNAAKDHAMAAYIAYVHAQRGLTGEELQRAMSRTAEAEEAFEQRNAKAHSVEKELAGYKRALLAANAPDQSTIAPALHPSLKAKRVTPPSA